MGEEDRVQFIPAEPQAIRKWLLNVHIKDKVDDADAMAAVDSLVPQKPLTPQEQREQLQERLDKANRQYHHATRVAEDMHKKHVKLATTLMDHSKKVDEHAELTQKAKLDMEQLQDEWDKLSTSMAADTATLDTGVLDMGDNTAVTGIVSKVLSKHIPGNVAADAANAMGKALKELACTPGFRTIMLAMQGGLQQQQLQQPSPPQASSPAATASTAATSAGTADQHHPGQLQQHSAVQVVSEQHHHAPAPAAPPTATDAEMQQRIPKRENEHDDSFELHEDSLEDGQVQANKRQMLAGDDTCQTQHGHGELLSAAKNHAQGVMQLGPAQTVTLEGMSSS